MAYVSFKAAANLVLFIGKNKINFICRSLLFAVVFL